MSGGPGRRRAPRLLRGLAIGAVALLVFHLLRTHVAERYLVPTGSMEPTLHGDPHQGDLVLVDKAGWVRSHRQDELRRFDLVVVRDGDSVRDHLVKRVVSMGDEVVVIRDDGDLFVRSLAGGEFVRVQKHPLDHRDLRMTFFEYPSPAGSDPRAFLSAGPLADGGILVPVEAATLAAAEAPFAAEQHRRATSVGAAGWRPPAWSLHTTVPIDVSFFDAEGQRIALGRGFGSDVGIELTVSVETGWTGVCFALELRRRMLVLTYGRDGHGLLRGDCEPVLEVRGRPLPDGEVTLSFGYLDGRLFLTVDEHVVVLREVEIAGDDGPEAWPENVLHFAVAGRIDAVRVARVRLFHDVFYRPEAVAFADPGYPVEPHEVFLLGDNSSYSVDSRRRGAFPASAIVGRPLAIVGPMRRMRWLPR